MSIYKVYIQNNKEYFEIWDDKKKKLLKEYSAIFTYTLCDYVSLDENSIRQCAELIQKCITRTENDNTTFLDKLLNISPVYMFLQEQGTNIKKSWKEYSKSIIKELINEYEAIKSVLSEKIGKNNNFTGIWERTYDLRIENINGRLCEVLYPKHTSDVLFFLCTEMLKRNITFKTCRRCKKLFPCFEHKGVKYCERVVQGTETCRQLRNNYEINITVDDEHRNVVMNIYTRAYKRHRRRVDYGTISKEQFKIWSKKVRNQRDLCLKQVITIAEFEEWIKDKDWNYE